MQSPQTARFFSAPTTLACIGGALLCCGTPAGAAMGCVHMLSAGPASQADGREEILRVEVVDRSGLLAADQHTPLFMGASFNGWNPGGTRHSSWLLEGETRIGWVFELPRAVVGAGGEFKFTRGSWETVEGDSTGAAIENRVTGTIDWTQASPVRTLELLGFEDRGEAGGGRGSAVRPTVVGSLDVWELPSAILGESRRVRVWLPEAYHAEPDREFGVFYFHDGQNVFDRATAAFGTEWEADEAMSSLVAAGEIGGWLVVGIDNSGSNRSRDYLPFAAGERAPGLPSGGADAYVEFLVEELLPEMASRYRVRQGPEHTGLGGSSLGGVVTLHAVMVRPGVFGRALVESPSLWVGDGRLLEAVANHRGEWPGRMVLAMGDAETGRAEQDARLVELTQQTAAILLGHGLGSERLRTVVAPGAGHNESAWQERLPDGLRFLLRE